MADTKTEHAVRDVFAAGEVIEHVSGQAPFLAVEFNYAGLFTGRQEVEFPFEGDSWIPGIAACHAEGEGAAVQIAAEADADERRHGPGSWRRKVGGRRGLRASNG